MQVTNRNSNINIRTEKDILSFDEFEAEGLELPKATKGFMVQLTFTLSRNGTVSHQVMVSDPLPRDYRFETLLKDVLSGDIIIINWNIQEMV